MSIISTIILGIVQGATEFLPVSSSGHLVIASHLLGDHPSFEFDVLVNFGTLLAVILYYRKRIFSILTELVTKRDAALTLKLILATLPAVIIGFLFQSVIEEHLHAVWIVALMLGLIGILMIISASWKPRKNLAVNTDLHGVTHKHALLIGLAQCVSLISGSSRSGTTILAALRLGFSKEKAAEWSFLMGIPLILGASLKVLVSHKGMDFISHNPGTFVLANVVSFITGIVAIQILMRILKQKGLYWFGWYRLALAGVLIVLISAKIL